MKRQRRTRLALTLAALLLRQQRTRDLIVYCPDAYPAPSVWPWKG